MKTMRMIIGIIGIVIFIIIVLQSCAIFTGAVIDGVSQKVDAISTNAASDVASGIFLMFGFLIAGIISISARRTKGGAITSACFFLIPTLYALSNTGWSSSMAIWYVISMIFTSLLVISVVFDKKIVNVTNSIDQNNL